MMATTTHPRIMPGLQSRLDGVHGGVEELVGSVSRLSFWSTVLGVRLVAGVMRDVTGGRVKMVVSDLCMWIEGCGSGALPRRRRRPTMALGFEENGDDPWSTRHIDNGFADGKLLHRLTTPSWYMVLLGIR